MKEPIYSKYRRVIVELLQAQMPKHPRRIAELGVQTGALSYWILKKIPDVVLIGVDAYREWPQESMYYQTGDPCASADRATINQWMQQALEVYAAFPDRCRLVRRLTSEAVHWINNVSLGAVIVDADHSYQGVLQDSQDWWSKLAKGGIMVWHDYGTGAHTAGVKPAVDRFAFSMRLEIHEAPEHVAWARKQ